MLVTVSFCWQGHAKAPRFSFSRVMQSRFCNHRILQMLEDPLHFIAGVLKDLLICALSYGCKIGWMAAFDDQPESVGPPDCGPLVDSKYTVHT